MDGFKQKHHTAIQSLTVQNGIMYLTPVLVAQADTQQKFD